MTDATVPSPVAAGSRWVRAAPILFGVTVFASAALVFLVEPMIAKMVLPTLGGSPSVWNTSMAFFQAALLLGYGYAHLLQRVASVKRQAMIHAGVLVAAAAALPLRITELFGEPSSNYPSLWLLGVLTVSLGAPFAALSATAPLAQAWYARVRAGRPDAANPYVLYAASNLGSLIALLAYPILVEPTLRLTTQRGGWTAGYFLFVLLMLLVAFSAVRTHGETAVAAPAKARREPANWRERLIWVGLAAIPSSLMLGVTTHITTDIASAPFLWVAPLALYLLTFIIAFSAKPLIAPRWALVFQAAALVGVVWTLGLRPKTMMLMLAIHLAGFFLTALVCHQSLASRRPPPERLTEFYLWLSVGGVVGGAFNAFLAPLLFNGVWEYPLVLALSCLARPSTDRKISHFEAALSVIGLFAVVFAVGINQLWSLNIIHTPEDPFARKLLSEGPRILFAATPVCAFLLRDRMLYFTLLVVAMTFGAHNLHIRENVLSQERSFFGVLRVTKTWLPGYSNDVRLLSHGTTLHGAQAMDTPNPCRPMTYYAPETPIGQVILNMGKDKRHMVVGAIGMGAGSVAAYARPDDEYRFYEIDPLVIAMSTRPNFFTYISSCPATSKVDWRLGDARLSVAKEKNGVFDVLLVDAFSSDAVPAHLLTVEAMRMYLSKMQPDGIIIMHLSNRNLDLMRPVAAVATEVGAAVLARRFSPDTDIDLVQSAENVIILSPTKAGLRPYLDDPYWYTPKSGGVEPWTDDFSNLFTAMVRQMQDRWRN